MPSSKRGDIHALQRRVEGLERRISELEKEKEILPSATDASAPRWVREMDKPLTIAVEDLGSIALFSYASKGSRMSIGDSIETIMEFKPDEIATLLKGLSNSERIKILKILTSNPDGRYAQELLEETHLSEGSLHYHLRWLLKSQMITQELTRGKYITTRLGVVAVSLIGILIHSIKV